MKCFHCSKASLTRLLLTILLAVTPVLAKDGRDFAGYYQIRDISEGKDAVRLTLQLKLFNYSDADIRNGGVALYDSSPAHSPIGGFNTIPLWRLRAEANLSQQFTIPRAEYERWQRGAPPALFFLFKDAHGHVLQRQVELIQRPLTPIKSAQ